MPSSAVFRLLLGKHHSPNAVHIPHSALSDVRDYERFFGCPVSFGAYQAGFLINTDDLQCPIEGDELVHQTAVGYLETMTGGHAPPIAEAVTAALGPLLPTGPPTIALVAGHFGLHPKALQRQLASENTNFAALLEDVRRETAEQLLRDYGTKTRTELGCHPCAYRPSPIPARWLTAAGVRTRCFCFQW